MLVIPAIDLMGGRCVRLYQGNYQKQQIFESDPARQARRFQQAGFQALHLIDLEGARDGARRNRSAIRAVLEECHVPVQVGGGIRSRQDAAELFEWGVQFLIVSTVALEEPQKMDRWVAQWGGDRFIVSLDLKQGKLQTRGWLNDSEQDLDAVLCKLRDWGMQRVICTDVERDGTLKQPAYQRYSELLDKLPQGMKLIAAGGVSRPEHLSELRKRGLWGAVVGRALYQEGASWEDFLNAG